MRPGVTPLGEELVLAKLLGVEEVHLPVAEARLIERRVDHLERERCVEDIRGGGHLVHRLLVQLGQIGDPQERRVGVRVGEVVTLEDPLDDCRHDHGLTRPGRSRQDNRLRAYLRRALRGKPDLVDQVVDRSLLEVLEGDLHRRTLGAFTTKFRR